MANRTNKQNSEVQFGLHRTEPNNTLVRFMFGGISNINNLVRFCSCSASSTYCYKQSESLHHLPSLAIITYSLDCERHSIPLIIRGGIKSVGNHESYLLEILGILASAVWSEYVWYLGIARQSWSYVYNTAHFRL